MFNGPDGGETFWGWRCIHCGEIIDQVILENRGKGISHDRSTIRKMDCSVESTAEEI